MAQITTEELKNEMHQHYGTSQYHRTLLVKMTDGMKAVCDKARAYWLVDAIGSHYRTNRKLFGMPMIFWRLTVKDESAVLEAFDDIPGKRIVRQRIEYTDFPAGEWIFYQQADVVFLPSEY